MRKKGIVLYGARLKRYFVHFAVSWGLLSLFSLLARDPSGMILFYVLLAIGVGGLALAGYMKFGDERRYQLSRETIEAYPCVSGEELRREYHKHAGRESRLDALALLLLAAFMALWVWVLQLSGEPERELIVGRYGLTAAPVVLSLVLLAVSLLPRGKKAVPAVLEEYIRDRKDQQALTERLEKPDLRSSGLVPCYMDQDGTPTVASCCDSMKPLEESVGLKVFMILLRVVCYGMALLWCIVAAALWGKGLIFLLAMSSILTACIVYFSRRRLTRRRFYMFLLDAGTTRRIRKKGTLEEDRVLSAIPSVDDATTLEICFEKAGTVQCRCTVRDHRKLLEKRDRTAYLLMLGKGVKGVFFEKEDDIEDDIVDRSLNPAPITWGPPKPPEMPPLEEELARIVEAGGYPSDEQIREAALRRLEAAETGRIEVWAEEKSAMRELKEHRAVGLSPGESERYSLLMSNFMDRLLGTDDLRDLRLLDDELRSEGITREEVAARKHFRLPLRAWLPLIAGVVIAVGGTVAVRLFQGNTGADLSWAYVVPSAATGLLAMKYASAVLNMGAVRKKFKRLQAAYKDPRFWSSVVEVEVYRVFNEQWDKEHGERDGN